MLQKLLSDHTQRDLLPLIIQSSKPLTWMLMTPNHLLLHDFQHPDVNLCCQSENIIFSGFISSLFSHLDYGIVFPQILIDYISSDMYTVPTVYQALVKYVLNK